MGSLLGQQNESSDLGRVATQRLRSEFDADRPELNRTSRNRTIRDVKEPIRRPVPIKRPAPSNKPIPSRGNKNEENNSGSKIPDLPGHGLPDKKEPQELKITSEPKNDQSNDSSGSGSKIPDLPGHGLPDKKEPQQMQVTSEPKNDSSNSDKDEASTAENESGSANGQSKRSSSGAPAPAEQPPIMQKLQSVDKKVWYGLGGGLALLALISIIR